MKKIILSLVLLAAAGASGVLLLRDAGNAPPTREDAEFTGRSVQPSSSGTGYQPVCIQEDFVQSVLYGTRYNHQTPTCFLLRGSKRDAATGVWTATEWEFSASYEILRVSANRRDRFYLWGKAPNGDDVIEFWKRKKIAMPGSPPTYQVLRNELYRGTNLAPVHTIGADYEQRYLLIAHGDPAKVSRMELPGGSPITTVFDAAVNPGLDALKLMSLATPRQHLSEGRLWILESWDHQDPSYTYAPRAVLYDTQNDGQLDSWLCPLTESDWSNLGYDDDVWDGDFVNKLPWAQ